MNYLNINFFYVGTIILILNNIQTSNANFQCYKCNSKDTVECATKPGLDLQRETCADDQDACIIKIDDEGHVLRDCIDSKSTNQTDPFQICNETLCNHIVFPPDRLKCYTCNGEDCFKPSKEYYPEICPIYKKHDKCVTQVIDETDAIRGCLSDFEDIQFGVTCAESGCNSQNGYVEISCIECNSENDKNCKSLLSSHKVAKCNFQILLGRPELACYTYHKNDKVIRGCYRDSGKLGLDEFYFKPCVDNMCNVDIISVPKCSVCGPGTDDPNCIENKITTCEENDSSCHSCLIDSFPNMYQRGCGKAPATPNKKFKKNTLSCYECHDKDGCNTEPFRKCFKCNSKTNPNCAGPLNLTGTKIEICSSSETNCLTTINIFGHTERGCVSDDFNANFKVTSHRCNGNLCNNEIFPKERRQCFNCNGTSECNLKQNENSGKPCEKYEKDDGCFEYIKDGKQIFRGCKTDLEYQNCLRNTQYGCYQCRENNCNNKSELEKQPVLSCYSCDENDKECSWSQDSNSNLKLCKKNIPLDGIEKCYIYRTDGKVKRSCYWDDEICSKENNTNCTVCEGDGCNNELMTSEKCIQLDLEESGRDVLDRTLCTAKNQTYEKRGCYVKREVSDNSLNFGCISDLTDEEFYDCKNNPISCYTCTDRECDQMKIPDRQGRKQELNCYKCKGNDDENCRWKQDKHSTPCESYVPVNSTETCFIRKDAEGKIERGCSYDRKICISSSEAFCEICDENDCNAEVLIPQECIQETYKFKEKKESDLKKSVCENPEQYWTNQGCYVTKIENNIEWGCLVDLSAAEFTNCTADTNKCRYCRGDECANMKVPNSAPKVYAMSLVLILCLIIKFF